MLVAARAADRGLGTGDVFATALEVEGGRAAGPFGERVRARASDLAAGRRPSEAVPVRLERRRMGVVAGLTVAAVALGLTANHQDVVRRRQAADQQVLDAEADKLRGRGRGDPGRHPARRRTRTSWPQRLEELARELASAPDLPQGQEALDAAARELAGQLSSNLLAQKAAVRGLDRSLASSPLPGASAGADAASQLRSAASALAQLSPEERQALAERLAALAATQAAGNTDAASALSAAAAALAARRPRPRPRRPWARPPTPRPRPRGRWRARRPPSAPSRPSPPPAPPCSTPARARARGKARQGQGQGQGKVRGRGKGRGRVKGRGKGRAGQGQGQGQDGAGRGVGAGRGDQRPHRQRPGRTGRPRRRHGQQPVGRTRVGHRLRPRRRHRRRGPQHHRPAGRGSQPGGGQGRRPHPAERGPGAGGQRPPPLLGRGHRRPRPPRHPAHPAGARPVLLRRRSRKASDRSPLRSTSSGRGPSRSRSGG